MCTSWIIFAQLKLKSIHTSNSINAHTCLKSLRKSLIARANSPFNTWCLVLCCTFNFDAGFEQWAEGVGIKISSIISSKSYSKYSRSIFYLKFYLFKIALKVTKYCSYFCQKFRRQDRSKIAESGHSVIETHKEKVLWQ